MDSQPTRCGVIEDSPSGVVAAVAAGMRTLGYAADEDPAALARAGATTFRGMPELLGLLGGDAAAESRPVSTSAARLRAAYEAFAAGDARSLGSLLSDDVTYHLPGKHLGGGILRGRAAVFERMAAVVALLDGPPAVRITGAAGHGEWIVTSERFTASRRGRAIDQDVCVTWHVPSTHCTEIWARFADQDSCDRFWEAS